MSPMREWKVNLTDLTLRLKTPSVGPSAAAWTEKKGEREIDQSSENLGTYGILTAADYLQGIPLLITSTSCCCLTWSLALLIPRSSRADPCSPSPSLPPCPSTERHRDSQLYHCCCRSVEVKAICLGKNGLLQNCFCAFQTAFSYCCKLQPVLLSISLYYFGFRSYSASPLFQRILQAQQSTLGNSVRWLQMQSSSDLVISPPHPLLPSLWLMTAVWFFFPILNTIYFNFFPYMKPRRLSWWQDLYALNLGPHC